MSDLPLHEFIPGEKVPNARGRMMILCAAEDCGKPRNAWRHRVPGYQAQAPTRTDYERERRRRRQRERRENAPTRARQAAPFIPNAARDKPAQIWQVELLALALDQAIAAGPEAIGWRVLMRAQATREAIGTVAPRRPPRPAPVTIAQDAPTAPLTAVTGEAHHAPVEPALARARQATKGIRNDRMRALAVRAVTQGAQVRKSGSGHLILSGGPLREPLSISTTGNGLGRGWQNLRASAARKGMDVSGL